MQARQNYKLTDRRNREKLLDYLYTLGQGLPEIRLSPTTGWHGQTYVGAIRSYGVEDIRWKDITPPKGENLPVIIGTLNEWIEGVAKPSHGNSRAMVAIGMGLAGCLIRLLGMESGGIHFWGGSGDGKTTLGKIACSTTGQSKLKQWRSTPNGMEAVFRSANDNLMGMDELSKDMGRYMSEIIYMMNGQGKNRMKRDTSLAGTGDWALLLFSTGEISLIDLLESAGEAVKAGQEVRFTDVPAAPAGGFGCFETVHGQDPAAFTLGIERACAANSGVALDAFLTQLQKAMSTDGNWCSGRRASVEELAERLTGDSRTPAIRRIARRFAVIRVALDLACEWGVLPWAAGDNLWAVSKLFREWEGQRGGDGSIEIKKAVKDIKHLLTTTEFSDRWYRAYDKSRDPGQTVRDSLGYRKIGDGDATEEFWVTSTVFDKHFCKGVNKKELVKELQRIGLLIPPRPDGKNVHQKEINGKANYFYIFPGLLCFCGEGGEDGEDKPSNPDPERPWGTYNSLHRAKMPGEGGEGSGEKKQKVEPSLHHLHGEKKNGEDGYVTQDSLPVMGSVFPSPSSPPSPQKQGSPGNEKEKMNSSENLEAMTEEEEWDE